MSGEIIYEDDWNSPLHKKLKERRRKDKLRRRRKQKEDFYRKQMEAIAKKQAQEFLDIIEEQKKDDMDDGNTIVI